MGILKSVVKPMSILNVDADVPVELNSKNYTLQVLPKNLVAATGSITFYEGTTGSVDSITVDGVEIMSAAVAFATDLETTVANVAVNINAYTSSPNYTAVANGKVLTITAVTKGPDSNGKAVVITTAGDYQAFAFDMANGGDVFLDPQSSSVTGTFAVWIKVFGSPIFQQYKPAGSLLTFNAKDANAMIIEGFPITEIRLVPTALTNLEKYDVVVNCVYEK